MQKTYLPICTALFFLFTACETAPVPENRAPEPILSHTVSESRALEHLAGALAAIDGAGTRASASPRRVGGGLSTVYRTVSGPGETRSGEQNAPLVYLVQFEEDRGSAILAADDRLEPVIAVYDKYVITETDFQQKKLDPEAWRTLENLYCPEDDDYYLGATTVPEPPLGELPDLERQLIDDYIEVTDTGGAVYKKESGWELVDYVRPMLTTKWHQDSPFNDRTPDNYPAGCVAIALAQIMAYHEFPHDYCDWTLAKQYDGKNYNPEVNKELALLSENVGRGCHMRYDFLWCGQSFCTPAKARRFLRSLGYEGTSKLNRYSPSVIVSKLKADCPVFIGALSSTNHGHAWVIDGCVKYRNTVTTYCGSNPIETEVKDKLLLHCNWGWGGWKDGYYISKIFDAGAGPAAEDEEVEFPETRGENSNDYDWWFRIVTYNKPT